MRTAGIVAEYNPFHKGHAWHIGETRRRLGSGGAILCVMSGNWVQRGECALTDKWTRAELALRGGADLVLELPLPWAISSAEGFAQGAVGTLRATGVVDILSFGSESGCIGKLLQAAEVMKEEEYQNALRQELDKGLSFAEARQKAALQVMGPEAEVLLGPNDNLGVEYIRAAGKDMEFLAIPRQGISHDSQSPTAGFASASYLRERVRAEDGAALSAWTLPGTAERLQQAGTADMRRGERAILARLRQMDESDWARLPDSGAGEGLPDRLVRAAGQAGSLEEFYALAKTRRYAHARIRRLALWAFLGLRKEDRPGGPAYLRVLGVNGRGRELLREMKEKAALPILTKPAHIRDMGAEAQRLFALESRSTDLYGLFQREIRPCGLELTTGPVVLDQSRLSRSRSQS